MSKPLSRRARINKALEIIMAYGGTDGDHHKAWVIDQVARVLADDYEAFVVEACRGADGPATYDWETGIAP